MKLFQHIEGLVSDGISYYFKTISSSSPTSPYCLNTGRRTILINKRITIQRKVFFSSLSPREKMCCFTTGRRIIPLLSKVLSLFSISFQQIAAERLMGYVF
uniref:Uncharacterized protein n=1 Tax=Paramoeba aestuarina TaxID=180227 RepID=A0A7S4KZL8_9EUKA|mmetsp:Transcript_2869/g.4459  ORF Transcript_2869/g.4459 Transcript_2869/m.4459 type:complete len:101 (+) Transcript_2869:28-330(+)